MPFKDLVLVTIQIVLFLLFAFAGSGYAVNFWLSLSAFLLTFGGIIICGVSLLQLGSNLTPVPTPKKNGQLVETGIYKYIRHPIYTGLILTVAGIAVYNLSYPRMIITAIILFFFLYKSRYEESLLIEKYPGYTEYMKKTGRLFPKIIR
jgi:protein-S-isoprenylcysteine O-methyltransferase Ste14